MFSGLCLPRSRSWLPGVRCSDAGGVAGRISGRRSAAADHTVRAPWTAWVRHARFVALPRRVPICHTTARHVRTTHHGTSRPSSSHYVASRAPPRYARACHVTLLRFCEGCSLSAGSRRVSTGIVHYVSQLPSATLDLINIRDARSDQHPTCLGLFVFVGRVIATC
jgi:hypothetical protein